MNSAESLGIICVEDCVVPLTPRGFLEYDNRIPPLVELDKYFP